MMATQNQVECDFVYGLLPKLREQNGENIQVFQDEWKLYLKELVSERKIPKHALNEWKFPKL